MLLVAVGALDQYRIAVTAMYPNIMDVLHV